MNDHRAAAGDFQGKPLPPGTHLVGLAALVEMLDVPAPVRKPAVASLGHVRGSLRTEDGWRIFDKRYWPGSGLSGHLSFALKHEDFDPLVIKRIMDRFPGDEIEGMIRSRPTGIQARKAWFLYEWMTGSTLSVPDAQPVQAVEILDPDAYVTARPEISTRHRIANNLLGVQGFCPVIRRTENLQKFIDSDLAEKSRRTIDGLLKKADTPFDGRRLLERAASFLTLADSKASFAIEGERPPRDRLERWVQAISQAGRRQIDIEEIVRLQRIIIDGDRFVEEGLRKDGVFLGDRDREGEPVPEFIGARPKDVPGLLDGMILSNERMMKSGVDPVAMASAVAFGFVYIHPLQDGNGRLHRYLIHHVLAETGFSPKGINLPVSSAMLDEIDEYRRVLQAHSGPLMDYIKWTQTPDMNVEVINETSDLYGYFDCTEEAEFLYKCITRTIEHDMPAEIEFLSGRDGAAKRIEELVDMPQSMMNQLIVVTRNNSGIIPRRRLRKEFATLTDTEVRSIEKIIQEEFSIMPDPDQGNENNPEEPSFNQI